MARSKEFCSAPWFVRPPASLLLGTLLFLVGSAQAQLQAQGSQFQVNTHTQSRQYDSFVSQDGAGGFVVVWTSATSPGSDNSASSIQGRRYRSDGTALGDQFQVNTYTSSYQFVPRVAPNAGGGFVVTWTSIGSPGTDQSAYSIQARRYNSSGSPEGNQFQVNAYTTNTQAVSSVSLDGSGSFVIVWHSNGSVGTDNAGNYSI